MADRRPDLEYLAAGYLAGLLLRAGYPASDMTIPTDDAGIVTGELVFVYAGALFTVSPRLVQPADELEALRG